MAECELSQLRILFFVLIWFLNAKDMCATQCSDRFSGASPVVNMCLGGRATGRIVVLDAQTATINDLECACFLTAKGSISLTVNAAHQPGYAGCGSRIDVLFSSPRELFAFNCFAGSSNQMDNGSTANFTFLKSSSASSWNYCLVLQVSSSDQSDSVETVCYGPALGQATSSTLEPTIVRALTSKEATKGTTNTSPSPSPSLSTTKTEKQPNTDYISSTVLEILTTNEITELGLSNSTIQKLSTTVPTTMAFPMSSNTGFTDMTNPTSSNIDLSPSTEKETSLPPELLTTVTYISTTSKDTSLTMNVATSKKVMSSKETQTSAETSFPTNIAASETTKIISTPPQAQSTSLETESTTDISFRSTTSPVYEHSRIRTSTPTSTSLSSNITTSSSMKMAHTTVTMKTTPPTITTSSKPTFKKTEQTAPTHVLTSGTPATVMTVQNSTPRELAESKTKTVVQDTSSSSPPPPPSSSPSSSSSSSPSPSPLSSSTIITAKTTTSTSLSLSSLQFPSDAATSPAGTNNLGSTSTTIPFTHLPNATMYASSPLPRSPSSSQSTITGLSTTTSGSTLKASDGLTWRNVTMSTSKRKEFELLPVVLPAALAGTIIITLFLFLIATLVIRHRRSRFYKTGFNGEYHNPMYSETDKDKEGLSSPIGYGNIIYTKEKELDFPSNGAEMVQIQSSKEKPAEITPPPPPPNSSYVHF